MTNIAISLGSSKTQSVSNSETELCTFVEEEVAFYTTLLCAFACVRGTELISEMKYFRLCSYLKIPKWDLGKFKAATARSIRTMGVPLMRLTFWLGPSMARLLVSPRAEQRCSI